MSIAVKETLSRTTIEASFRNKLFDAGEMYNRRRRDIIPSATLRFKLLSFVSLLLIFFFPFQISRTLSNYMFRNVLSTINGRERRWRPANSLPHRIYAAPLPESQDHQSLNFSNTLQKSDLTFASHFPRAKLLYIPEEYSHWASLMARVASLGPSDAPCPVKTSTVHGESSVWESNLPMGKINCSRDTVSISANVYGRIPFNQSSPKMDSPSEASPPVSIRRRSLLLTWPTTSSLGFWLEGWTHKLGPLISLKPKSIRYDPAHNIKNSRSGPITLLLSLKQCICRFLLLAGRRLQKRKKPYSLFWLCNVFLRILVLVSPMGIVSDPKSLKIYNLLYSIAICRSVDCDFGSSMPKYHPTTLLSSEFKPIKLLFRTPLLPVTEKNRTRSSSASQCIKPAIREAKYSSSTSQDLLIVTISKIPEPFVEVSSTHRVLACSMLLVSLCFRVYMNLSLKFIAYPIFLMYGWKTLLQNFVSVASLWVE